MKKGVRLLSPFGITQLCMAAVVLVALCLSYYPWRWGKVKDAVRAQFPGVIHIEGPALESWIARNDKLPPVLLDVRAQAEYDAGHLPGAHHMSPDATPTEVGFGDKNETPYVLYCSVGFDSASVASSLIQRGYKKIQVLDGGIFLWANEGRSIEGATGKVNPGNSRYTYLLKTAHRAPQP